MRTARSTSLRLSLRVATLLLIAALAACAERPIMHDGWYARPDVREAPPAEPAEPAERAERAEPRRVGGDRDEHGCYTTAGYLWCAREQRCVRPWELAKEAGFDDTAEGFAAHCDAPRPARKH